MLYRSHGVSLQRDSYQQAEQGKPVQFGDHEAGHIAFFKNSYGRVGHTGYLLSRDRIIHASGRVRVDAFTKEGIYNTELKTLTHRLHSIKNVF
jgi:cell wall-associated NlpC family hydrolase